MSKATLQTIKNAALGEQTGDPPTGHRLPAISVRGRKHVRPGTLPHIPRPPRPSLSNLSGKGHIGPQHRPVRLLLVDDQPSVLRSLRMNFECEEGLQIVGEALDAETALAMARDLEPDLVLMDTQLPGMSGIDATAALRNRTTVVILTMYDDEKTRAKAMQAGAAAFVGKCEPVETLVATIREAVERGHA
jgi:CheY-like chemotaxis protein